MAQGQDYVAELRNWLSSRQSAPVSSTPQGQQVQRPQQSGAGSQMSAQIGNAIGAALKQRALSKKQAAAAQQASAQYAAQQSAQQQQMQAQAQMTGIPVPQMAPLQQGPAPQAGPLSPGQLQPPGQAQQQQQQPSQTPIMDMLAQFQQQNMMQQSPAQAAQPMGAPGAPSPNFVLQQPGFGR